MRTTSIIAIAVAAAMSAGCLRVAPPKTPNQRAAERGHPDDHGENVKPGRTPIVVPPAAER